MDLTVRTLCEEHTSLLNQFQCTEASMSMYLKKYALDYTNTGEGNTQLLIKDGNEVVGYFTLKCTSLPIFEAEMSEEPKIYPAIEIARFAIHSNFTNKGIGSILMSYVLELIAILKKEVLGVRFTILFAINKEDVLSFYEKMGFKRIDDALDVTYTVENEGCIPMYLRI